jgi:hypothetical protein
MPFLPQILDPFETLFAFFFSGKAAYEQASKASEELNSEAMQVWDGMSALFAVPMIDEFPAVVDTKIPLIDDLCLNSLVPCANSLMKSLQGWRDARKAFLTSIQAVQKELKDDPDAKVEGEITVPVGIKLMILRMMKWLVELRKKVEDSCKDIKYGALDQHVFDKGLTLALRFSFKDQVGPMTIGMAIEYEAMSSQTRQQLEGAKEKMDKIKAGQPDDLVKAFQAFSAYCQTFKSEDMTMMMKSFETGFEAFRKFEDGDLNDMLEKLPTEALAMITDKYNEEKTNLFDRFQVIFRSTANPPAPAVLHRSIASSSIPILPTPTWKHPTQVLKPEGLPVDMVNAAMEVAYPAKMIETMQQFAMTGGVVGEAISRMEDEYADKISMPDLPNFISLPDFGNVKEAGSRIAKQLTGELVGNVLLGSTPVTGVILGIRKAYKMMKKAYNLANQFYQKQKARALKAAGNAVKQMHKSLVHSRFKGNVRELKASMSAIKTFPRQVCGVAGPLICTIVLRLGWAVTPHTVLPLTPPTCYPYASLQTTHWACGRRWWRRGRLSSQRGWTWG